MQLAMIGLGKMGLNMTRRLVRGGHAVVAHDLSAAAMADAREAGAQTAQDLPGLVAALDAPRAVWVMVPAGDPTENTLRALEEALAPGDLVVDGGNSNFHDSVRRGKSFAARGLEFVDAGVSGGVWGLENGYSLMVGGSDAALARLRPVLETLAPGTDQGWGHVGPVGAGHYVRMVHNGIEYGLMQAYAEGFEILHASDFGLDLKQLCDIWEHGSVVRSWLL